MARHPTEDAASIALMWGTPAGPFCLALAVAVAAGMAVARPVADLPSGPAEWRVIVSEDGQVIGHTSEEVVARPDGREIIGRQQVLLKEQGKPPSLVAARSVERQDASGRTVSIQESTRTGRDWSRVETRILGDKAEIVRITPGGRRRTVVDLPADVRFDAGRALIAGWDTAKSPRLEFQVFDPGAMGVERIVFSAAPRLATDPPGATAAVRKRYKGDELRGVARLTLDGEGRALTISQPMFGTSVIVRRADRETALKPHPPFAVLPQVTIKSPYRIMPGSLKGRIRYRFAFKDGIEFELPQTGEQRATSAQGAVTLEVCGGCGPGLPEDRAYLETALEATAWLQHDDRRIRDIARPVRKMRVTEARKMELLADRARPFLGRVDFAGHYSAAETLTRRAGDCTEAAALLAALGRAAGIPTKVANGLVYSRERYHGVSNVFMPHSWVLAYVDGEWRSFDAALDVDSSHIAFNVGDGDQRSATASAQLGGMLRLESMAEVRTRPAGR
jgi:hypothetical protein